VRAVDYAFRQGWASLRRGGGSTVFAVVAIALAMSVLGGLLLITWNLERLLARWTASAEFSVYLRDDATSEQRGVIEGLIDQSGAAAGRDYVSKEQALVRFRSEFAELASTAAGIGDNPFPASIEVRMQPAAETDGRADALLKRVATLPGVADVRYDRAWLARVGAGIGALRRAGGVLALMMAVAAAATVAAVVRLGLHARREELEIMQLVGASMAFIRGPFVAEGVLQGGIGALAAVILLWGSFSVASASWGTQLAAALEGVDPQFLPARLCALLVAGGMLVGGAGGFAASRHAV
jgi:cell division transport system permease protein